MRCTACTTSFSDPFPFFFLMTPLPPRSTLFPYTTLFRSRGRARRAVQVVRRPRAVARGAAPAAAHELRPRDAARDRNVCGDRELLAPPHPPATRRGAVHTDGRPTARHAHLRRRIAPSRAAKRRDAG